MRTRRSWSHRLLASLLIPSLLLPACQVTEQRGETQQAASSIDSDCDGITDDVERQYGLDPQDPADAEADPDGDDLPTIDEIRLGSDPTVADTDRDGIPDGTDLQGDVDLDGDGMPSLFDNCPQDPNKSQHDSDGDGIGDACDADAPTVAIAEAYSRSEKDYALLPLRSGKVSRTLADRGELMAMPSSFRIFAHAGSRSAPTRPLIELYHPTTKDHAYVSVESDRGLLIRQGYRDLGVLGYLADQPLMLEGSTVVRRFANSALKQEAVTIDATTAQQLLAAGFVEKAKLGYAILDPGHLRRPRSVVRYHKLNASVFRHQATPVTVAGYISDGPRFRVLPEKISGALPLYRMRNNALVERLTSDAQEVAAYVAQGYITDGVIGWILDAPGSLPTQATAELWRLERQAEHRYAADSSEIDALVQAGWIKTRLLGYAFPGLERAATCAGPTPVHQLEAKLVEMAARPDERATATLTAIVASCSLERVLDGNSPANVIEKAIADRLPVDPEVRRRLRASAARWDEVDPALRAQALGKYAALDPGACTGPIDVVKLRDRAHDAIFAYSGTPPSLREPFCDGTLYAPTDPAAGSPAEARAVTVDAVPGGEFGDSNGGRPRLKGVLDTEFVRGHPTAQAWATSHPDIGFSVGGVSTGISCSTQVPCPASQGLRCASGVCLAYPIVRNQQIHTFTGTNFWDVIDGDVVLRDTVTGAISRFPDEVVAGEPDDDTRCSPFGLSNHATIEDPLSLTRDRFYEVEVVNKNGLYYEHAEDVPADDATARANGRTIHVCWRQSDPNRPPDTVTDCSLVNTTAAACPLDGPACTAATGGTWGAAGQRPRSLQLCQQNGLQCGETPAELSSRSTNPNGRQYIYVEAEPPVKTVTTTLQAVTCYNETGADWTGSDELGVLVAGAVGAAVSPSVPAVEITADAYQHSYDSGDNHTQLGEPLVSVQMIESDDQFMGAGGYLMMLLEDDSGFWQTAVGVVLIAAVVLVAAWLWPALANPLTVASIAVILAGLWTAFVASETGPDDLLGRDAWWTSIADITDRGGLSHDVVYNALPQLPTFDGVDLMRAFRGDYEVSVHPAVDALARVRNSDVTGVECSMNSDCAGSDRCVIGLCVPSGWWDVAPAGTNTPPGFIERREFLDGGRWRYDVYLGWQVKN